MGRDERQLRRMRGEALSRLLQGLTYGGCLVIFYALMAIPNWPLRNLSRTSATTLVTWVAMGAAMLAAVGSGLFPDLAQAASHVKVNGRYTPNTALKPVYDRNYRVFRQLHASNKKNFALLNRLKEG